MTMCDDTFRNGMNDAREDDEAVEPEPTLPKVPADPVAVELAARLRRAAAEAVARAEAAARRG